jgi:hypothetical protein
MQLTPDQFTSLKRILTDPVAKVCAVIHLQQQKAEKIIETAIRVSKRSSALGKVRLLFLYSAGATGGRVWNDSLITELIRENTCLVSVGDDGSVIGVEQGSTSIMNACTLSEPDRVTALCSAGQIMICAAGKPISELITMDLALEKRLEWERSWTELPQALNDHFIHCVSNEQNLRYWSDRRRRILLAGPDGTEKLFHHSLFWWCYNFIKDAFDVYGEAQSMGQDKTDITIVTESGSIVVEVKWLGKNENNTTYVQVRIEEGLRQVADYMRRNSRLIKGYLVIYDARDEEVHQSGCSYPESCKHDQCEEPLIFFLRSETPSELAARTAT